MGVGALLLLSPSDGLASFLEITLANGVKVVEKVITSKFRFHLIAIYALGCFRNFIFDLYVSREKVASSVPEMRLARKKNLGPVKY
jgi:hypothetical protein